MSAPPAIRGYLVARPSWHAGTTGGRSKLGNRSTHRITFLRRSTFSGITRPRPRRSRSSRRRTDYRADAKGWATEFHAAHAEVDELELVLVGPRSQGVIDLGCVAQVVTNSATITFNSMATVGRAGRKHGISVVDHRCASKPIVAHKTSL